MPQYLLDTNHCSKLLGKDAQVVQKFLSLGETQIVTCVIAQGELMFAAYRSRNREANLALFEQFFNDIEVLGIDAQTTAIYGQLKAAILNRFGLKERAKRTKFKLGNLGISENDLWIAAIAKRHDFVLVNADADFQRIKEAGEPLMLERWYF